jgi:hypothetical protein
MLTNMEQKEFSHINNKRFKPGQLFKELYKCGVNLLPVDKDAYECQLTEKSVEAEDNAISDLAIWIKSFFIKSSKWNCTLTDAHSKILVRLRENLEYDVDYAEN